MEEVEKKCNVQNLPCQCKMSSNFCNSTLVTSIFVVNKNLFYAELLVWGLVTQLKVVIHSILIDLWTVIFHWYSIYKQWQLSLKQIIKQPLTVMKSDDRFKNWKKTEKMFNNIY